MVEREGRPTGLIQVSYLDGGAGWVGRKFNGEKKTGPYLHNNPIIRMRHDLGGL